MRQVEDNVTVRCELEVLDISLLHSWTLDNKVLYVSSMKSKKGGDFFKVSP